MIKSAQFTVGGMSYLAAYETENTKKNKGDDPPKSANVTLRVSWLKQGVPLGLSVLVTDSRDGSLLIDKHSEGHDVVAIMRKAWRLYPFAKQTMVFHGAVCCHDKQRCTVCTQRLLIERQARKAEKARALALSKERKAEL